MFMTVELSHGNLAYVMIILFINIKLLMIDNYLSKGFPGQLHEALCKYICTIFAQRVHVRICKSGSVGSVHHFK